MSTLLLRLAGPMQTWGSGSKFNTRMTETAPTKSGVIGMISAALGRKREDPIDDLAELKMSVRVDREGQIMRDFHTAHNPEVENWKFVTNRYYLADAVFTVALEGDQELLKEIETALNNPVYPLFLGRRSCPPTLPITLGIVGESPMDVFKSLPLNPVSLSKKNQSNHDNSEEISKVRVQTEDSSSTGLSFFRSDAPLSFSNEHRRHGKRRITEFFIEPDQKKKDFDAFGGISSCIA